MFVRQSHNLGDNMMTFGTSKAVDHKLTKYVNAAG